MNFGARFKTVGRGVRPDVRKPFCHALMKGCMYVCLLCMCMYDMCIIYVYVWLCMCMYDILSCVDEMLHVCACMCMYVYICMHANSCTCKGEHVIVQFQMCVSV